MDFVTTLVTLISQVDLSLGGSMLLDYLTQGNFFIAAGAIYMLPVMLKKSPPVKKALSNQWVVRFMPLYPLLAGTAAVLIPGMIALPDALIGTKVVGAIWCAALSMMAHKFLGQTLLGDDPRITTLAVKSEGQVEKE